MTILKTLGRIWIVLGGDDWRLQLVDPDTGEYMITSVDLGLHYREEV